MNKEEEKGTFYFLGFNSTILINRLTASGPCRSFQMVWGLGLEPRFSDSKSDVLPIRRPPNTVEELAWGPGVEPGFSDPESDVLPIRRSPKAKSPSRSKPTGALVQKADHSLPSTM